MVIIIGAGLSGLLTAYRLKIAGIPFKLLEARNRIGGRIHTINGKNNSPVEMGATWFTPQHQHLIQLLQELNIPHFEQYMKGSAFFQPQLNAPAQLVDIPQQTPSYRISEGTINLLNQLYRSLDQKDILLNQSVKKIIKNSDSITVEANESFEAKILVLAMPPKLWNNKISFKPNLSDELVETAKHTHTWMEDSIKVAIVYEQPFWRIKQQSGTFFSNAGPIAEFYDHCNLKESTFSLCGFVNQNYRTLTFQQRKQVILDQLKMTFGAAASHFIDYYECDWSKEKHTYSLSDHSLYPHQNNGNPIFKNPQWDGNLLFSSTEVSPHFGGYMEGAVYSANAVSKKIQQQLAFS